VPIYAALHTITYATDDAAREFHLSFITNHDKISRTTRMSRGVRVRGLHGQAARPRGPPHGPPRGNEGKAANAAPARPVVRGRAACPLRDSTPGLWLY
jgi:hypothetical protein